MSDEDDTRVLNMRINNKQFLKGAGDSVRALDTLNKGVEKSGNTKGMQNLAKGVDTVRTKFGAMQIAGVTALANITNRAVNAGINLVKSLTISPIMDGFREYEKLLNSTQTIMANTGKSTQVVGRYLDELNAYSDQTIYNFGQMADNIGKFTAAGVNLKDSVASIKGLANTAALAGSDANQLNTAMYQMSQALASGSIKLMDWNSLVNAGLGGKNVQNAIKYTAQSIDGAGAAMEAAIKKGGSFRDSLQYGWLSADVFTKTMKVMAGATNLSTKSVAELTEMGYGKLDIKAIKAGKSVAYSVKQLMKMGYTRKAAEDLNRLSAASIQSATKIKTFTQLMDVVKESVGSGWAQVFRALFGDLEQSGKLWTSVGDKITTAVGTIFTSITNMLNQWRKLGGYEKLWGGIGNVFKSIGNILRPFLMLFQQILPSSDNAGSSLYNLTDAFYKFSVWLEKVTSNTSVLNPVIDLLGMAFKFVFGLIGAGITSFVELVKVVSPLTSSVFGLIGALGNLVGGLFNVGSAGEGLKSLFDKFIDARTAVLEPIVATLAAIVDSFTTLANGDLSGFKSQLKDAFGNLAPFGDMFARGKEIAGNLLDGLREGWSSGKIQADVKKFVDNMVNFFKDLLGIHSPSTVFAKFGRNIVQGLVQGISALGSLVISAVGELASSIGDAFSNIDRFDLANVVSVIFGASVFLTIRKFMNAFAETMSTFKGFADKIMGEDGLFAQANKTLVSMQQGIKAKALLNIAIAVGVLAASLWLLSKIPYPKLISGLIAVGVLLKLMVKAMETLFESVDKMASKTKNVKSVIAIITVMSFSMLLMAGAILALSAAVFIFGKMDPKTLLQGLAAVAAVMAVMAGGAYLLGKAAPSMILAAGGLLILSVALAALAPVILLFSKMNWGTILSGLAKMAVVLVALGLAMAPLAASGPMILVAAAALVVLSAGLSGMLGLITLFASVSWGTIIGGVLKIAAALLIIGAAASIAAPGLISLGIAVGLIGVGLLAAGAGMALLGVGIAAVAAAGTAGAAVLIASFEAFLSVLPLMAIQLVNALNSFLKALADKSPEIVDSLVKIGGELLRGITELGPKITDAAVSLIGNLLDAVVVLGPQLYDAGYQLIQGFLEVLRDRFPELIQTGTDLLVGVITGVGEASARLVIAAGEAILNFLNAVNQAVIVYEPQIIAAGLSIGKNLILGLVQGLVPQPILDAFTGFVNGIINFFKGLLGINSPSTVFAGFGRNIVEGLTNGVEALFGLIGSVFGSLVNLVVNGVQKLPGRVKSVLSGLGGILKGIFVTAFNFAVDAVKSGVSKIGDGIAKIPGLIRGVVGRVGEAASSLGKNIISGIGRGIGAAGNWVADLGGKLKSAINGALNLPKSIGFHKKILGKNIGFDVTIPAFKKGTTGFRGGSALVGEAGPELVTMNRGSNVITNKTLAGFMKSVLSLTQALTSGSKTENSPGGNIQYTVGAAFRGNPKNDGAAFAANLADGLINGLKAKEQVVNSGMSQMATGLSNAFANVLEINSPSRVFRRYAGFVGQGFINGLVASVAGVRKATKALGKASILEIAKTITDGQLKLESIRGKADAYERAAAERRAQAKRTKDKKQRKLLEAEARALEKEGKRRQKAADQQQKRVESQNAAAARREQYKNADTQGKADMKREDAATVASRASAAREKAIRLSLEADLVRKRDRQRARELDKAAKEQLRRAKVLAQKSESYAKESHRLAEKAKREENAETAAEQKAQIQSVKTADVLKAQAAFAEYTKSMQNAQAAAKQDTPSVVFQIDQTNTSPEALSPADIFRHNKSLLALAEAKLTHIVKKS